MTVVKKDVARRCWTYGKDSWSGPLVRRGGDEYGNSTLAFRLPGGRALIVAYNFPLRRELEPMIVAYNFPLRRELEPFEGTVEYGAVAKNDPDMDPISILADQRFDPLPGWKVVRRVAWYGPWEEIDPRAS